MINNLTIKIKIYNSDWVFVSTTTSHVQWHDHDVHSVYYHKVKKTHKSYLFTSHVRKVIGK